MSQDDTTADGVRAALARLHADYERIAQLLGQFTGQDVVELAGECAESLRRMSDDIARIRNQAIADIWEAEKLSLATLAQRIGVSKTRADQIIRAARAARTEGDENNG